MNPNPILFQISLYEDVLASLATDGATITLGFKRSAENPLELEYSMIYYEGCWTMSGFRAEMIDAIIDFAKESNIVIDHDYKKIIFHSEEDLFWVVTRFT